MFSGGVEIDYWAKWVKNLATWLKSNALAKNKTEKEEF